MDYFNLTNFQLLLLSQSGFELLLSEASLADKFHLYLPQLAQFYSLSAVKGYGKYYRSLLLSHSGLHRESIVIMNFISTYRNLVKTFSFPDFFLKENHEQSALQKNAVIVLFPEQLKTYFENV